ncbi:FHA domain-containing protein [Streptomyces sp. NPDC008139]|uniref:FHA domain-containing protein n=1 Tax=Streptomyces sp. NPDC008139 TaxID=3364814 RepID=UPI0036ED7C25
MREAVGAEPCPECGTAVRPGQLLCQGCFVPFALMAAARAAQTPPQGAALEAPAEPTALLPSAHGADSEHTRVINVIPGALPRPLETRRDAPPRALRLRFPSGEIVPVEPANSIRLGRDPKYCPAVPFLAAHDNLSRIHATVGVEPDGSAWISDESSTNGTFVHGYRLAPGERAPVRPGDTLRLAADVTVRVLL